MAKEPTNPAPQKVFGRYPDMSSNREPAPREQITPQGAQENVPYKSGDATPNKNVT